MKMISKLKRTLSFVSITVLFTLATFAARSEDVFEIRDIYVDVTADTVTEARKMAMREAEGKAIDLMLKRLTLVRDHELIPWIEPVNRAQYIQNFSVSNEKTSATRYLANLNFTFKAEEIRKLLKFRSIPFAETLSKPFLILPLFEDSGQLSLFEETNPWRTTWEEFSTINGLVPLTLPLGDLTDLSELSARQVIERDETAMNKMAERYNADQVVVAQLGVTARNQDLSPREVNLVVQRFGKEGTSRSTTLGLAMSADETSGEFLNRIASIVHTGIEESWKRENLLEFGTSSILPANLRIKNLSEWVQVRKQLSEVAVVQKVELALMSRDVVQLNIHFLGNIDQLITSLQQVNIDLMLEQESWFLTKRAVGG